MSHTAERSDLLAEGVKLRRAHAELQRKRPVNVAEQTMFQAKLGEFAEKVKAYRLRSAKNNASDLA